MKIKLIIPYFGKLHPLFEIYFVGIKQNKKFDFLIITDQFLENKYSPNLEVLRLTFEEFTKTTRSKLEVEPKTPYKICDFKPFFGALYEDYLDGYDYWGYSDIDMIIGNLDPLYNIALTDNYYKILDLGHLSLCKNVFEVNYFYKSNVNIEKQYKYLLKSSRIWVTDESFSNIIFGVNRVLKELNFKLYLSRDLLFDTSPFFNEITDSNEKKAIPGFIEYNGNKLFFINVKNNSINKKEIIYSHFLKRTIKIVLHNDRYILIPEHWNNVNNYNDAIQKLKKLRKLSYNHVFKKYLLNRKKLNFFILLTDCFSSIEAIKILTIIIKNKMLNIIRLNKKLIK